MLTVCVRVEKEVGGMEMAHEGMIWSLAWHPLGHILCSGSNDHTRYIHKTCIPHAYNLYITYIQHTLDPYTTYDTLNVNIT